MRKLALALALLVAAGVLGTSAAYAADDAAKKCEAETDAAKKEECLKAAKGE